MRFRQCCRELFEFFGKAHVEHLVGFVHHEELNLGEIERTAVQMIKRASRRGNNDMYAAF